MGCRVRGRRKSRVLCDLSRPTTRLGTRAVDAVALSPSVRVSMVDKHHNRITGCPGPLHDVRRAASGRLRGGFTPARPRRCGRLQPEQFPAPAGYPRRFVVFQISCYAVLRIIAPVAGPSGNIAASGLAHSFQDRNPQRTSLLRFCARCRRPATAPDLRGSRVCYRPGFVFCSPRRQKGSTNVQGRH
jgi:hypothetical protein